MAVITITKDCIHAIVLEEKRNAVVALRGSGLGSLGAFAGVNPFRVESELARMENYYDACMESTKEQDPVEQGTYCTWCRMTDTAGAKFTYEEWSGLIFADSLTWGK
jgi:hypothetical protein